MYLGIDLGTSSLKALLITDDQQVVGSTSSSLIVSRPESGWSEQDPQHWIEALQAAMSALKSQHPKELGAVRAIGLSGQMHGATLLDKHDAVLRPCMLWNDSRAHKQAQILDGQAIFRQQTGNIVFPGFTAPKAMWVENNEPDVFSKIAKILLPKDYLRLWLTGEYVSEMSDASGTSWLDVGKRKWSSELLESCALSLDQMPKLVEGSEPSGILKAKIASQWGMENNVIVAGGAGDNAATAIGMGIQKNGDAFLSLGTSGVVFAATNNFLPKPESAIHAFCHALPDKWHQMGVVLSATDSLNWYANITQSSAKELTQPLGDQLKAPSGITFLPYLSGERTPHNDANIRGAFTGLDHRSDRETLTQAVLEGVAFAIKDNLMALEEAGTKLTGVTVAGGGSKSEYWLKLMATILNVSVKVPKAGELGAVFGAARLAMLSEGNCKIDDICTSPVIKNIFEPQTNLIDDYDDAYSRYKSLYSQIKETP
ncbi:MAG: xylulokinase [Rhizobiaceae bacterium]